MQPYSVVAFNTATASANKIHDDAVARRFGFRGGLVPGVDVYAYLCHLPVVEWGLDWLSRGAMAARFALPVYDGRTVTVTATSAASTGDDGEPGLTLELRDDGDQLCAWGTATLPPGAPASVDVAEWPDVEPSADPPPAAPEVLMPGTAFGLAPHRFHADVASSYLTDVREAAPIYAAERVAHPGWILRDANYVLSANVRLGPWIHVESIVQHHAPVADGQVVSARALVTKEWEHKGHRFVTLDVLHLADDRPAARTLHTAIYHPRGA